MTIARALLLLTLVAIALPAHAFTLLTTKSGVPKVWHKNTLQYRTVFDVAAPEPAASEGSPIGDRIHESMQPWSETMCDKSGDQVSVAIGFEQTAAAEVATCPEKDDMMVCAGGDGVVRVISDEAKWPITDLTVGYTLLSSSGETGQNSRFVLLLNDANYDFCDTSCDGTAFDLRTVVLHEAGHVLGLDHSSFSSAVMAAGRTPAEILRSPQADDIAGLCTVYPTGAVPDDDGGICSAGRTGRPGGLLLPLFLAAIALLLRRRMLRGGAGIVLMLLIVALPDPASAYTLARSASGAHQRWTVANIAWDIDDRGLRAQGIDDASTEQALRQSFAAWESVQCGLCHDPKSPACAPVSCAEHALGVSFAFDGWKEARAPGLGCAVQWGGAPCSGVPDGNQVLFVYDKAAWPVASHVIALTLVAADKASGQIGDADILVNTAHKTFCVAPACELGQYDLQNTATHEVGHLLGLDHSEDSGATMYGGSPPQEVSKRELSADDILGVCTAYRTVYDAAGCPTVEPDGCCAARGAGRNVAAGAGLGTSALAAVSILAIALRRSTSRHTA